MKKLLSFLLLLLIVYNTRPLWEEYAEPYVDLSFMDAIGEQVKEARKNPVVIDAVDTVTNKIESWSGIESNQSTVQVEKPALATPDSQMFSVYNVQIGDAKTDVEQEIGTPKRRSQNEYGVDWYAYHENYHNFLMVSYDENNRVNGLYTSHDLISSTEGIALNTPKETVRANLGEPVDKIRKGMTYYILNESEEHDYYHLNGNYVAIFYDVHEQNTVTAIQIIDEDLEKDRKGMYAAASASLKEGFEYQLFDVTNATRLLHGLPVLTWDDQVRETARDHSLDMAKNKYFDHTNLQGESPFDRMEDDGIQFMAAGENLAYGQYSSIFAHEGLMNSAGHRKNILQDDFRFLGVGVAFNEESQPYYTENFFDK
ncbi:CAP domain-containing protein [Domibacillus epiphyticus]|uniref:Serine protease n=1 Tax=Domibacillus epiphyticus TaxID=1714355 RepID=A0A1V2AC73_9BACI|nr:CAP domain-containing protein [Domibacillus epiphyticus]OMP68404.1 serine protease [Domibacillus epiphyticus]